MTIKRGHFTVMPHEIYPSQDILKVAIGISAQSVAEMGYGCILIEMTCTGKTSVPYKITLQTPSIDTEIQHAKITHTVDHLVMPA